MINNFKKVCPRCFTEGYQTDNFCMQCGFDFSRFNQVHNNEAQSYNRKQYNDCNHNINNLDTKEHKEDKGYTTGNLYN